MIALHLQIALTKALGLTPLLSELPYFYMQVKATSVTQTHTHTHIKPSEVKCKPLKEELNI